MDFEPDTIQPLATGEGAAGEKPFAAEFRRLTGQVPYRWQERLYHRFVANDLPSAIDLPTGLGKTSVMVLWLLARAANPALHMDDASRFVNPVTLTAIAVMAKHGSKRELRCVLASCTA